ncbi:MULTISPECIES: GNAT family N-acetyltransferase [unclassified Crossiella]|uniref:GNAT family N-acetyltransferase n=1 Tax=unclassified Crossiella TaxID=2620835 RepID=UPI001FFEAF5C|nr:MULTISPECIES: GNAT family N-acetyltransferase [unclassified Crossiella]MCK2244460.1 GNAT family N-acetyltransferase [Crossiella sp. S99.2]MCK2258091.1 GNAT family N-acetyltransferase [Crossiella sp. S99.1]
MSHPVLTVRPAALGTEADALGDLLVEYMTWATGQLRATFGIDSPTDPADMRSSLAEYAKPSSVLLVAATESGELAGTGALRTLAPGIVEIKRMYVRPAWRGQGVGSRLLDGLVDQAIRLGASTIRLDTARFMADAQGMYRSRGFAQREPYPGTEIPPHLQQYWFFFERTATG